MGEMPAGSSNTEQPIRSVTKYVPEGSSARRSQGIRTSSPRSFSTTGLLFQNFQREAAMKLHAGGAQQGAHGFGGSPLASDDFAQVFWMHTKFNHRSLRPVDGVHLYVFRMIHKCPSDGFYQL